MHTGQMNQISKIVYKRLNSTHAGVNSIVQAVKFIFESFKYQRILEIYFTNNFPFSIILYEER